MILLILDWSLMKIFTLFSPFPNIRQHMGNSAVLRTLLGTLLHRRCLNPLDFHSIYAVQLAVGLQPLSLGVRLFTALYHFMQLREILFWSRNLRYLWWTELTAILDTLSFYKRNSLNTLYSRQKKGIMLYSLHMPLNTSVKCSFCSLHFWLWEAGRVASCIATGSFWFQEEAEEQLSKVNN